MRGGVRIAVLFCALAGPLLGGCGDSEQRKIERAREKIEAELSAAAGESTPEAEAKTAKCLLWPSNFRGACAFAPLGRGSFSIRREENLPFYDDVTEIIVFVYARGRSDVRTVSADGTSRRLGEASRSETYPACWIGDGFSVCAY